MNDTKKLIDSKSKSIDLNRIGFSEIALRTHAMTDENVIELADEIMERGLLNVPTVVPVSGKEGYYIVTDGARRVTALKLLLSQGKIDKMCNFQVKAPQDDLSTLSDMIAGNFNIKQTAKTQYIEALYRLATESNLKIDELAKKAGIGTVYMLKLFKSLRLPETILKMAESGKVTIANLISLSELHALPQEDLELWVEKASRTSAKQFAVDVATELDTIREAAKGIKKERKFELTEKLLSKEDLRAKFIKVEQEYLKIKNPINEARLNIMKEIYQIDERSAIARKAEWDKIEKEREDKKNARKANREKAKIEEVTASLEKQGFKIVKPSK
jgi:ParB-like chromosome segregation protein Spo0J